MSLAGCAEISGLGELEIGDATGPVDAISGIDVTAPDVADAKAGSDADAHTDGSTNDVNVPSETGGPCNVPSDCTTNAVCCETFSGGTGQLGTCSYDADTVACTVPSDCPTTIGFNCAAKDLFRRCATNTDCTETSYPKCCTGKIGDAGTRSVCLNTQLAQAIGATCL